MPVRKHRLVRTVVGGALVYSVALAASMGLAGALLWPVAGTESGESAQTETSTNSPERDSERIPRVTGARSLRATVVDAATRTTGSLSARVRMEVRVRGRGDPFTVDARGFLDGRQGLAKMKLDLPGVAEDLREIVTRDAVYVRTARVGGAPKIWVRTDRGNFLTAGSASTAADPFAVVGALRAAADDVALDSTARVDGVETIVYVGEVDLRRALPLLQPRERRTVSTVLRGVRDVSVPFTVHVDRRDRVRRLDLSVSAVTRALGTHVGSVRVKLFAFGVKKQVNLPSAGQVTEEIR